MLFSTKSIAYILALASFGSGAVLRSSGGSNDVSGSGYCEHLSAWIKEREYSNGDKVIYWGYIWTAATWSYNNPPSELAAEWIKSEFCEDGNQNSTHYTRDNDKTDDWGRESDRDNGNSDNDAEDEDDGENNKKHRNSDTWGESVGEGDN